MYLLPGYIVASAAGSMVHDEYFNRFDGNDREIGEFYLNYIYFERRPHRNERDGFCIYDQTIISKRPGETFVTLNVNTARGISRDYNVRTILNGVRSACVFFVYKSPRDLYSFNKIIV